MLPPARSCKGVKNKLKLKQFPSQNHFPYSQKPKTHIKALSGLINRKIGRFRMASYP
jgi:hypothetical protein